jgi:uncharacterized membrane protein
MRKLLAPAAALTLIVTLAGCGGEQAFIEEVKQSTDTGWLMEDEKILRMGHKACESFDEGLDAEMFSVAMALEGMVSNPVETRDAQELAEIAQERLC